MQSYKELNSSLCERLLKLDLMHSDYQRLTIRPTLCGVLVGSIWRQH